MNTHKQTFASIESREHLFVEKSVTIDGRDYFYREINPDAPLTIIKIHGVTGNSFDMIVIAEVWAKLGYRVVMPDLPGHDRSPDMPISAFSDMADWLHAFTAAVCGDTPPAAIVGNSFGSAVCYTMAARHGLPIGTRLILCCPTPTVASITRAIQFLSGLVPVPLARALYLNRAAIKARVAYLLAGSPNKEARALLRESEVNKVDTVHVNYASTISGMLLKEEPYKKYSLDEKLQKQVTVVLGGKDNVVTKEAQDVLHGILPLATFQMVPESGHIMHFEAYRDVAKIVNELLT